MSQEWKEQIKAIKQNHEKSLENVHIKEASLKEKYKDEKIKLTNLIREQLKILASVYVEDPSTPKPLPEVRDWYGGVTLSIPFKVFDIVYSFDSSFELILTEKGYVVTAKLEHFDHTKEMKFYSSYTIEQPITDKKIQDILSQWLKELSQSIVWYKEIKEKQMRSF